MTAVSARSPLTLGQAAAELGVHYQTAYRWVRQGELAAVKRNSVYEVEREAITELRLRRQAAVPIPAARRVRSWNRLADRLYGLLRAGDETRAREAVDELVAAGVGLAELCDLLLVPVLRRIGDEWSNGELGVAVEHRASAICGRVLGRWSPASPGRPRGVAVVCAAPGDEHGLPGLMATVVLRERHWKVHHLGVGVPPPDVAALADTEGADLVAISVTWPPAEPAGRRLAELLAAPGRRVLLGAPGATTAELLESAERPAP